MKYLHPYNLLVLERRRQLAYLDPKSGEWDVLDSGDLRITHEVLFGQTHQDSHDPLAWPRRQAYEDYVPEQFRATFVTESPLPLNDILAVEEDGDAMHHLPILYIRGASETKLLLDKDFHYLETERRFGEHTTVDADPTKRVPFFKDFKVSD